MTREREDQLLAERSEIRRRSRVLIQRIVDARLRGEQDEEAMAELAMLSAREVELTQPDFAAAA